MHPLIKKFLIRVQRRARKKSLEAAIKQARLMNETTKQKVLVYFVRGEFIPMTKQEMKQMWKDGKFGDYSMQQVEAASIAKIETYMGQAKDKKPTAAEIKALQEQTKDKKGKTVKK